ncbi:hypothetical protein NKH77_23690 [Streptomyces sp. M19]
MPGYEVVRRLATWSWLATTEVGRAAFLFLAHPPPHAAGTEGELLGLAWALGLRDDTGRMGYLGRRIRLWEEAYVILRTDDCAYDVQVAVGEEWAAFVRAGGPVVLAIGLDPIEVDAEAAAVDAYLRERARGDRIRQEIPTPENRWPAFPTGVRSEKRTAFPV